MWLPGPTRWSLDSMALSLPTANGYTVGATILLNGTGYVIRTATADAGATLQITEVPGSLNLGQLHFEQHHRHNCRCFDRLENWR